jgi:methionyl-tRNA synthetase
LTEVEHNLFKQLEERFKKYTQLLDKVEIKEGLKVAMEVSSIANKYIQDSKPFDKQVK